jgi:hypothetical protein
MEPPPPPPPPAFDAAAFARDGVVVIAGVLTGAALESFRDQVSKELTEPCIPPVGVWLALFTRSVVWPTLRE